MNRKQKTKTMQSRKIADVLNVSDGGRGLENKEKNLSSNLHNDHDNQNQHVQIDSGSALQQFLDHIPISAIAGIKNSPGTFIVVGNFVLFKNQYAHMNIKYS